MQTDYLELFEELNASKEKILKLRTRHARQKPAHAFFKPLADVLKSLPAHKARFLTLDKGVVAIGKEDELDEPNRQKINAALKRFMPWKKGPYQIFGTTIDAEWRSDLKWQRLKPFLKDLTGNKIADIGCHNGYFMFRAAAENPKLVVGFEPFIRNYYNFCLLQHFAQVPQIYFERFGVEYIHLYENFFDTVFCLGILYHHHNPIGILRKIHRSMTASGQLVIECQGIAGDGDIALMPKGRYANARGVWFLPTATCLETWLRRAHFREINSFLSSPLNSEEQRSTEWASIESIEDFLDPTDPTKTKEGYPAPLRHYVVARK